MPAPGVVEDTLGALVLGTVLALLLNQRGLLVLHSSAVDVRGGCVGFVGESGWGKSTMAAALWSRGHALVADDILAIELSANKPQTQPGFPRLKLYAEAAEAAGFEKTWPIEHCPLEDKVGHLLTSGFSQKELPLNALYILAYGDERRADRLRPQDALIELIRHSYPTRLNLSGDKAHLQRCNALVQRTPIYRLTRPPMLPALDDLARFIEDHLAATT